MKSAVIDIGSNSVRLMLWADGTTLYKRLSTTRLAEGIADKPVLSARAMERTAQAIARFRAQAEADGAEKIYAFATAAVRSAHNGGEFCALVKNTCGLETDVVSGEEEALLGTYGALGEGDGTVVDVGGASTELCRRVNGETERAVSLNIGAVRLYDMCRDDGALLAAVIEEKLSALDGLDFSGKAVAGGGTATTLASVKLGLAEYDAAAVQGCPFTAKEAGLLAAGLLSLSAEARKKIKGMDENRADIIAGGALLLASVMKKCDIPALTVSDRDNLEGYALLKGI